MRHRGGYRRRRRTLMCPRVNKRTRFSVQSIDNIHHRPVQSITTEFNPFQVISGWHVHRMTTLAICTITNHSVENCFADISHFMQFYYEGIHSRIPIVWNNVPSSSTSGVIRRRGLQGTNMRRDENCRWEINPILVAKCFNDLIKH